MDIVISSAIEVSRDWTKTDRQQPRLERQMSKQFEISKVPSESLRLRQTGKNHDNDFLILFGEFFREGPYN